MFVNFALHHRYFYRYLALGIVGEHTIDAPMVSWEDPFMPYDVDTIGITALQVSKTLNEPFTFSFSILFITQPHNI